MAYDATKDQIIWKQEAGSLEFSVVRYNGGEPKLQISRVYTRANGSKSFGAAGRLDREDLAELVGLLPAIQEIIEEGAVPAPQPQVPETKKPAAKKAAKKQGRSCIG